MRFANIESPQFEFFISQLADPIKSKNTRDDRQCAQKLNCSFETSVGPRTDRREPKAPL